MDRLRLESCLCVFKRSTPSEPFEPDSELLPFILVWFIHAGMMLCPADVDLTRKEPLLVLAKI